MLGTFSDLTLGEISGLKGVELLWEGRVILSTISSLMRGEIPFAGAWPFGRRSKSLLNKRSLEARTSIVDEFKTTRIGCFCLDSGSGMLWQFTPPGLFVS